MGSELRLGSLGAPVVTNNLVGDILRLGTPVGIEDLLGAELRLNSVGSSVVDGKIHFLLHVAGQKN
jgi:hypothetical protein